MSQKLELTWVGKDQQPRLEPRILLRDENGYSRNTSSSDISGNLLIHGDNLLALRALLPEYEGKIKCIYIDPPFNTGVAFTYYNDNVEHSLWLSLMRGRFQLLHKLLQPSGVFVIQLDDTEMAYAKVLLDEIFGRQNYLNTVTTTTNAPSGFKATGATIFSTANYLMFYAKDRSTKPLKRAFIRKAYDTAYAYYILNPQDHFSTWNWSRCADQYANELGFENARKALKGNEKFEEGLAQFAVNNASRIFQTASIGGGAAIKRQVTIAKSRLHRDVVIQHPDEDVPNFLILNGRQMLFYKDRLVEIDGEFVPGEIITDVWTDIGWTGIASEGSVEFKNGKKPEALLKRVMEMTTERGDIVLDSFGGSGTTGAVAHKMGRRWIMIELGDHATTHIVPRLKKIIDGNDTTGVTEATKWRGGGGYHFCRLAPSMLERDAWGNWIISKQYNAGMLAEAMCKHMGFRYAPTSAYWNHGYSSEYDFIYVTTQPLTGKMLAAISYDVGERRHLLICCKAFQGDVALFKNLSIKRIPQAVLNKCEWDHDDYSFDPQTRGFGRHDGRDRTLRQDDREPTMMPRRVRRRPVNNTSQTTQTSARA